MGFYIRKSVSVGPFRLNFSKSGFGLSAGVKGFRVGINPSGQYIHVGRGGLYYRQTFPNRPSARGPQTSPTAPPQVPTAPSSEDWSLGPMSEYKSVSAIELTSADSQSLIKKLNEKDGDLSAFWSVTVLYALCALGVIYSAIIPPIFVAISFLIVAPALYWLHQWDAVRRTTALFFDLDGETLHAYANFCDRFAEFAACQRTWRLDSRAKVLDGRFHAGAGSVIQRTKINPSFSDPPGIRSNISTPTLRLKSNTFYFYPDKILVRDQNNWGAISWDDANIEASPTRFIEEETVPSDAQVVDHTWRFVRNDGGPDRRFNNNRQIPICQYGLVLIEAHPSMEEHIHSSNCERAIEIGAAITTLKNALKSDLTPKQTSRPAAIYASSPSVTPKLLPNQQSTDRDKWWPIWEQAEACAASESEDKEKAVDLYGQAAVQGSPLAWHKLGRMFELGLNVEKDHAKALEYFTRAVEFGNYFGLLGQAELCLLAGDQAGHDKNLAKFFEMRKNQRTDLIETINDFNIQIAGYCYLCVEYGAKPTGEARTTLLGEKPVLMQEFRRSMKMFGQTDENELFPEALRFLKSIRASKSR